MANEIKGMDDYLRTYFGYSAPFFRFPMEDNDSNSALNVVGSLGYTSVFWSVAYSDWDLKKQKGEEFAFNTVMSRLHRSRNTSACGISRQCGGSRQNY